MKGVESMKEFNYINDLGARKKLVVYPLNESGKHPVTLWCMENGELAGTGELTPEEVKDWLAHYGITDTL